MPRCTVCAHPQRAEIDAALLSESYRVVASRYGLHRSATERHRAAHLPVTLTRAAEVRAIASADRLLAELNALYAEATAVRREARENGSGAGWAFALAESHRLLKTLADVIERMQASGAATREQAEERAAILHALRPYPAALLAVIQELENSNAG